jgi:hypothetical protein
MPFKEFYLSEMPHNLGVDFRLEKPNWNKNMIELIKKAPDIEILLDIFYRMGFKKMLQKKFSELSNEDKSELLSYLPQSFIKDMEL